MSPIRANVRPGCTCDEGHVDGKPLPQVHDCAYIAAREGLIPMAKAYANQQVRHQYPKWKNAADEHGAWSEIFMRRMDELWRVEGRKTELLAEIERIKDQISRLAETPG